MESKAKSALDRRRVSINTGGIISTKEARKLLGKDGKGLKDIDLVRIISDMTYLAEYMLNYFAVPHNGKVMVK